MGDPSRPQFSEDRIAMCKPRLEIGLFTRRRSGAASPHVVARTDRVGYLPEAKNSFDATCPTNHLMNRLSG